MSIVSSTGASTRQEACEHFQQMYGMDMSTAHMLARAERLQEKGQLEQALLYFNEVLAKYPNVNEARMNIDMIHRMRTEPPSTAQGSQRSLPRQAELSWYGEDASLPGLACEYYHSLKRLPNGRSEFTAGSGLNDQMGGGGTKICFPREQSDQLWHELLEAIDDGSGLHTDDPTPWDMQTSWGTVGEQLTVSIEGQPDAAYFTNNSPVDRILKKFLEKRKAELGY